MQNIYEQQSLRIGHLFTRKPDNPEDLVAYRKAHRKSTKPEILVQLSTHPNKSVIHAALLNPNIPVEQIVSQYNTNSDKLWVLSAISLNPSTPSEILEDMWVQYKPRKPLVANTALNTMIQTTEQLNEALQNFEKTQIIYNKYELYDDESVQIMLNKEDLWLKLSLLNFPRITDEILWKLAEDQNYRVVKQVAGHKKCSPEMLTKLSKNRSMKVKKAVAKNKNTPIEVLRTLVKHDSNYIKQGLIANPNSDQTIIETVLKHPTASMSVRKRGIKLLKNMPEYEDYPVEWLEAMFGVK